MNQKNLNPEKNSENTINYVGQLYLFEDSHHDLEADVSDHQKFQRNISDSLERINEKCTGCLKNLSDK